MSIKFDEQMHGIDKHDVNSRFQLTGGIFVHVCSIVNKKTSWFVLLN